MPINFSSLGGSSSGGGGGGFVINTGDYSSDTAELSTEFAAGAYGITVSPTDTTIDIYLIASDGSFAGYTNTGSITATIPFDKVVVLGSTASTILSFIFNGESQTATTKGQLGGAGAVISSVVTSSLPSVDDTTVVNGGNFGANVEVSFINQSAVETAAKAIVRSSSTQLIITRPDAFSPDDSPYTVKVVNPGVPVPAGTAAHLAINSVTAGTNPVWTTDTEVVYNIGEATNHTFLATDSEASDIDYSVVSGTLPDGLTFDGETGVLSGTYSGAYSASVTAITIRAIDTGGNFLDKAFNFIAFDQVIATGGTVTTIGEYRYHTFTSSGTLSVSDGGAVDYLVVAGGGGVLNGNGGGGGAGGMLNGSQILSSGSYSITVGSAGSASNGGNSVFNGITSVGGGKGSNYSSTDASSGGSGGGNGGTTNTTATGTAGQGYRGGGSDNEPVSGGGGGAGGVGFNNFSLYGGKGGPGAQWVNGVYYASGGGGGTGYGGYSNGLQGSNSSGPGNGATVESTAAQGGIVIIRYVA